MGLMFYRDKRTQYFVYVPSFNVYVRMDGRKVRGDADYLQTTAIEYLGEMYVPADIPEAAQEAMVKQQVTDWVNSRPRTEDGDVLLFAESSVEAYIDGARFP